MPEGDGTSWRRRLEPDAVWRAIDRARQAPPSALEERRALRAAVRYLRDQLDALFCAHADAVYSTRVMTDLVLELLYELDAVDLRGVADVIATARRRQAYRRRRAQLLVRPRRASSDD